MSSLPALPTTVSVSQLRNQFSALKDERYFTDDLLTFWLMVASAMVSLERWATMWFLGVELFAAHHAVLDAYNQDTNNNGGIPGLNRGAISAESAGPVSLSYDTATTAEEDGGHWNLTVYGTRYLRLLREFGAGPVYVGAGFVPPLNGPAWPGPWTAFLPTMNN